MIPRRNLSVLVVHHAPLVRFGISTLLRSSHRFRVIAETGDATIARQMFTQNPPDLVVLGLTLARGDGVMLLKDFKKLNPRSRSLVITSRHDSLSVKRAFKAGARGYVVTEDETIEVLRALDQISDG